MVLAILLKIFGDLSGKFARRLDNERAWHTRPGAAAGQDIDHWQNEGRRLACACLGDTQNVTVHQDIGDGFFLDGRGFFVTRLINGFQQFRRKPEIFKEHVAPIVIEENRMAGRVDSPLSLKLAAIIRKQALVSMKDKGIVIFDK